MKGYWIASVRVTDEERYKKYVAANAASFEKYGAKFLVRAGAHELVEGDAYERVVVLEFPSYEAALECYRSPEYQAAFALRKDCSLANLVIAQGYDG